MIRTWTMPFAFAACVSGLLACPAAGAAAQTATVETVETEPIRCWLRTSIPAVRVGEPFSVVLTCAVVETDTVTVVPDQAELAPNVMQLPPFDVIGGSRGADLRTADHRFFQYEYRARLVNEDLFGEDVKLPELRISYKVRTHIDGEALEGRDQSYVLPDTAVHVLSLVPASADDIRDASLGTFSDIERRRSRANLLRVVGGILIGFAALAAFVAAARIIGARRGTRAETRAAPSLLSDSAILRGLGRELSALDASRRGGEWTPALTGRLLTALRILSAYALELGTPVARTEAERAGRRESAGGQLTVRSRGLRRGEVTVPGWVTPAVITTELARLAGTSDGRGRAAVLEELRSVLSRLTAVQYGRDQVANDDVIDEALASGTGVLRRLRVEHLWIARKLRGMRFTKAGLEERLWSH